MKHYFVFKNNTIVRHYHGNRRALRRANAYASQYGYIVIGPKNKHEYDFSQSKEISLLLSKFSINHRYALVTPTAKTSMKIDIHNINCKSYNGN
jgi:hypothetical protein